MLEKLPFDLLLEIINRLDYTCFPKLLHINRAIRVYILNNWVDILGSVHAVKCLLGLPEFQHERDNVRDFVVEQAPKEKQAELIELSR